MRDTGVHEVRYWYVLYPIIFVWIYLFLDLHLAAVSVRMVYTVPALGFVITLAFIVIYKENIQMGGVHIVHMFP